MFFLPLDRLKNVSEVFAAVCFSWFHSSSRMLLALVGFLSTRRKNLAIWLLLRIAAVGKGLCGSIGLAFG